MHNALWPFLISQVLPVLTDHQEEFAITLAFKRSCSPVWYTFALTSGVAHSPTTICIFAAHRPQRKLARQGSGPRFAMHLKALCCMWLGWENSTQAK